MPKCYRRNKKPELLTAFREDPLNQNHSLGWNQPAVLSLKHRPHCYVAVGILKSNNWTLNNGGWETIRFRFSGYTLENLTAGTQTWELWFREVSLAIRWLLGSMLVFRGVVGIWLVVSTHLKNISQILHSLAGHAIRSPRLSHIPCDEPERGETCWPRQVQC